MSFSSAKSLCALAEGPPLGASLTAQMFLGKLWNLSESFCHKNKGGWNVNITTYLETVMVSQWPSQSYTHKEIILLKRKEKKTLES